MIFTIREWELVGSGVMVGFGIGVLAYWYFIRKPILKKNPFDKERKEWNSLLHQSHNVISLEEKRGHHVDMKLLDLYLKKRTADALFWHNFWSIILTSLIVILTGVNIWLSFYN